MIPLRFCRPFFEAATVVKKHRQRHHRGIGHHARRAARAVVSKPAIAGYVCIALWWPSLSYSPANGNYGGGGGDLGPTAHYYPPEAFGETPPEFQTASLMPPGLGLPFGPEFFAPRPTALPPLIEIPIIGPPILLPELPLEQPTQQPVPTPEPASWALLGTALAALAIVGRKIA